MIESKADIFLDEENVEVFGLPADAGVLLQGKGASDGVGHAPLLKQSKHFAEQ